MGTDSAPRGYGPRNGRFRRQTHSLGDYSTAPKERQPAMVLTVTLNPCLDKSLFIQRNAPIETLRAQTVRDLAGGKGVNVSRALRRMGVEVASLMPLGGHSGAHTAELARLEGLE